MVSESKKGSKRLKKAPNIAKMNKATKGMHIYTYFVSPFFIQSLFSFSQNDCSFLKHIHNEMLKFILCLRQIFIRQTQEISHLTSISVTIIISDGAKEHLCDSRRTQPIRILYLQKSCRTGIVNIIQSVRREIALKSGCSFL